MSSTNGHTPTRESLREQIDLIELSQRLRVLQSQEQRTRLRESTGPAWGFGSWLDPMMAFRDLDFAQAHIVGSRYNREDGRNRPFVWNEIDRDWLRGQGRWIGNKNKIGRGIVRRLVNYTINTGFTYEAQPAKKFKQDATVKALAELVQVVLDEFADLNQWWRYERHTCETKIIDGDCFLRTFDQGYSGDGITLVRPIDAEQVRQPPGTTNEWLDGIRTVSGDIMNPEAYSVAYERLDDWEEVSADEIHHLKANVPLTVKRGISDFFTTQESIDAAVKLQTCMDAGASAQASIAWVTQFKGASPEDIGAWVGRTRDQNYTSPVNPITGKTPNRKQREPGTELIIDEGREYLPAPRGENTSAHTEVLQSCYRAIGQTWDMPEFMISGDASNANYSSTLISGAPFVVQVECEQKTTYKYYFLRILWVSVKNAAKCGRFILSGHRYDWQEISALIDINVTPPQVAISDKTAEASVDSQDIQAGVMSKQERRRRRGLDNEQMKREIAEEQAEEQAGQGQDSEAEPPAPPDMGVSEGANPFRIRRA